MVLYHASVLFPLFYVCINSQNIGSIGGGVTKLCISCQISEVIEHLPQPEDLILKLQNHCKSGLIISIPNTGYIRDRLRLFFGLFPLQWAFHPSEHLRFWTIRDFKWWIKSLDLQLIGTYPANGITVLNLYKIWPNLFARNVVYLLKNKS